MRLFTRSIMTIALATAVAFQCIGTAQAFGFGGDGLCVAHDPAQAQKCSSGDIMLYQPRMFGNEQLPIIVAAAFCDFEHPVVYNAGGVTCMFTDDRKGAWKKLLGE